MANKTTTFAWVRCRGMNTWDVTLDVPADQGTDVLNMHFYEGGLGTKRAGSSDQTPTGVAFFGITSITRFVPAQDDGVAEIFLLSEDATAKLMRVAGGTTAVPVTILDAVATGMADAACWCTFNGKLYLAYDSLVNRLHVYDPGFPTANTLRRSGMVQSGPPTVINNGSGSYPAILRYYKVAAVEQRAGVVVRRANTSTSVAFTPSGSGAEVRVFNPLGANASNEGETHYEVYGSIDDLLFYGPLATVSTGTGIFVDTMDPHDYDTLFDAEPNAGANTPWPSVKFLTTDGTHLIGFGAYETTAGGAMVPKAGRVYFSPALDSSGIHDDERVSNTTAIQGWIDLSHNSGGIDRGLGRLGNTIIAFQSRGIYLLTPTGNIEAPLRRVVLSSALGAVSHQSIVEGEDGAGAACLYFLDPELGPYRLGANGLQWIGKDVKAIWDTINQTPERHVPHGIYYKSKHQVIWWLATRNSNDPNLALVFDVTEGTASAEGVRYGWSRYTGTYAGARCSALLPEFFTVPMSRAVKPYVGLSSFYGTKLLRGDDAAEVTDDGTPYQAYLQSGSLTKEPLYVNAAVLTSYVHADASDGVTLTQTLIRGTADETPRVSHVVLTAIGTEVDVLKKFEAAALADAYAFQVRLGDQVAVAKRWTLNRWYARAELREER
jgi:hypothetical protein